MKRCPQCNRAETDETLKFCRVDGAILVGESSSLGGEAGTAQLGSAPASAEIETSILPHATDASINRPTAPTTVLPAQSIPGTTRELTRSMRRLVIFATGAVIVAAVVVTAYFYFSRKNNPVITSIAVMPFVNDSGNADVEYLSDGMTETLISSLSQLPNLNVKPRSSVFRYKGKETDPQTIAKELNVQAVLNGRIVQRGQDISLFVELIDISLDKVVWSETYNRKQTDLVTLQADIARDVSGKIKTKLSGDDIAKVTKTYTTNPEAYQLYLKGNYFRTKYNEEGYKKGIEYYRKAIEIDPNYALAYVGIANAYSTAADWYLPPNEAYTKAKVAALKALELDNSLAVGHTVLGSIAFWYEWDWATCERELKRAIELDPINSGAYQTYAFYFAATGRFDQAIEQSELAQSLTPLDLQTNLNLAVFYNAAGQHDRTIEQARKTIELDQNYWFSYVLLGLAYERKGMFSEAIAAIEKAHSLDNNPAISGYLGYVYAVAGKKAEAQKVLDELKELSKRQYVPAFNVAFIYAGLNDKDHAFELLNKAYEERSGLALIRIETVFDNLHSDPRFKAMLKRLNLPE